MFSLAKSSARPACSYVRKTQFTRHFIKGVKKPSTVGTVRSFKTNEHQNDRPIAEPETPNELSASHPQTSQVILDDSPTSKPAIGGNDVDLPLETPPNSSLTLPNDAITSQSTTKSIDEASSEPAPPKLYVPIHHGRNPVERLPYWQSIPRWQNVTDKEFLNYGWALKNGIQGKGKLTQFLDEVLPADIPGKVQHEHLGSRQSFIKDFEDGVKSGTNGMMVKLTPHILSLIDWKNPIDDPLRRQFIPLKSAFHPDHQSLEKDPLHEKADKPVKNLVHRYNNRVLFLATSICGLYCRFCTRAYGVGPGKTEIERSLKNWQDMINYITAHPEIEDVVVSGGDSYFLRPSELREIGNALLKISHIRRFRVASKGLCVTPSRTLDPNDEWTAELIGLSKRGREIGKEVALHTHFNHAQEFSWVTQDAAQKLFANNVIVRNQSVLLKGVNDSVKSMSQLLSTLADNNIQPYYVYQCDLVPGVEDLRTPLSTILNLEHQLRGSIAGSKFPHFVIDLPGGGGKRSVRDFERYDAVTGKSTWTAPAVKGGLATYEYWDPLPWSEEELARNATLDALSRQVDQAEPRTNYLIKQLNETTQDKADE